ncbi:MAG TPA: A/G-specific adenine glycosylase [Acidobacteriaceae bacterium]|nr:A/G-specific adenine glycosylase [Acidobacteriaceae bacterium]
MKIVRSAAKEKALRKRVDGPLSAAVGEAPAELDVEQFRRRLMVWYRKHARKLPWRGIHDAYATWLSEIMLQQTRVAAVQVRYVEFLKQYPTLQDLAAADERDVLTLWSGLGYYRRARMLHRAAQFVVRELGGQLPSTAAELRTLPGVGDYTAAAIASIAFGESIAVVDGNVERVLLRIAGEPEEKTAAARAQVARVAQMLVPPPGKGRGRAKGKGPKANPPGDHNQAMMELGATICVPRGPLCLQCPVVEFCRTRGEHVTMKREKQHVRRAAYLLAVRTRDARVEVLLEQRAQEASLMAGMFELPPLPLDAVDGHSPVLRVRHAITDTNYAVEVYAESEGEPETAGLLREVPANAEDLHWASAQQLHVLPLTGLARKVLVRMGVMKLG